MARTSQRHPQNAQYLEELLRAIVLDDEGRLKELLVSYKERHGRLERTTDADPADSPLFKAVSMERVGCVRLLIEAGEDTSRIDRTGASLLHLACRSAVPAKGGRILRQLVFARCNHSPSLSPNPSHSHSSGPNPNQVRS
jgi:hypothetical protein